MNIFGYSIPMWIVLSVGFGLIYLVFSGLSALKRKKIKAAAERKQQEVKSDEHNI